MSILLVQGCSKTKNRPDAAVPALELYRGYFFNIIKKAIREGDFDERIDICILSAEHGILDADEEIEWYDRRMDAARAAELAPSVQESLEERVGDAYERVIVNVGAVYRRALGDVASSLDATVHYIEGEGIGVKGHVLKRVVRGDVDAVLESSVATVGNQ